MRAAVLGLCALALSGCELAEPPAPTKPDTAGAHAHGSGGVDTPAARKLDAAMAQMHSRMGKASADPDESFMRMMIPHHQGAIEMARIQLEHGKDPQARRLAEQIIAAQEREIAEIQGWLARRGPQSGSAKPDDAPIP